MKNKCININHADVQELAKQLNLNSIIVAARIGDWQDINNTNKWPSIEDITVSNIEIDKPKEFASSIFENPTEDFPNLPEFENFIENEDFIEDDKYYPKDYIEFRKNILKYYHNRLNVLTKKIKLTSDPIEKGKLQIVHQKLAEEIYGNGVDKLSMEQEIDNLTKVTESIDLIDYVKKDLDKMQSLLDTTIIGNFNYDNLLEALDISRFYMRILDLQNNPLFTHEQLSDILKDNAGSTQLSLKQLEEWVSEAKTANIKARLNLDKSVINIINELDIIKNLKDFEGFTIESLTEAIADTDLLSSYTLSPNRVDKNKIPEIVIHLLRNSINEHLVLQQQQNVELMAQVPTVEKTLIELGESYNLGGVIKGASYKLFYQKNETGGFTTQLIQRYSHYYNQELNRVQKHFNGLIRKAYKNDNSNKSDLIKNYKEGLLGWYKNNTNIFDFTKVAAIRDFINSDTELNKLIAIDSKENFTAKDFNITDKHFDELVAQQIEMLKEYKIQYYTKIERYKDEEGVNIFDDISDKNKSNLEMWNFMNSPLIAINNFDKTSNIGYYGNFTYNHLIPKKLNSKGENTNYYDKDFDIVEKHDSLYNFRNTAEKIFKYMSDSLPKNVYDNFIANSLPMHHKNYAETMVDLGIWGMGNKLVSDIKESISTYTIGDQQTSTLSKKTGLTDYSANNSFINANKILIRTKFKIKAMEIADDIKKEFFSLYNEDNSEINNFLSITINEDSLLPMEDITGIVLEKLAFMLNVKPDINEIKRVMFVSSESSDIPVGRIIKNYVINEVVEMSSFNLPKTLGYFSKLTAEYNGRSEVLPMLNHLKDLHKTVKTLDDKERIKAVEAFEDQFNNKVLGLYNTKEKGKVLQTKVYSKEDKKRIDEIKILLKSNTVSKEDKEFLKEELKNIGRNISANQILKTLIELIRKKILGLNPKSEANNYIQGKVANEILAASGKYFKHESYYRAAALYRNPKNHEKFKILLNRLDVFQDATNEYQEIGLSTDLSLTKLGKYIKPYALRRVTEEAIQTPLMGAFLIDNEIVGKDGITTSNIWDALDENGMLKEEFRTDENINNWEKTKGKEFDLLKGKIISALKVHGDYDELGNLLYRRSSGGRAFMVFKSWLPEIIYKYWGEEHMNLEGGIKHEKGILRSATPITGALIGFSTGGSIAALPGAIGGTIAGGIMPFLIQNLDANSETQNLKVLQELVVHGKVYLQKMIGLPANLISGKMIVKQDAIEQYQNLGFTENDAQNLTQIMQKIAIQSYALLLIMVVKGLLWDPDDEKDSARRRIYNLLSNRLVSVINDLSLYANPKEFYELVMEGAVKRTLDDVGTLVGDIGKFINGDDIYLNGPYRGQHRVVRSFNKLVLPTPFKDFTHGGFGIYGETNREYNPNQTFGTPTIERLKMPSENILRKKRMRNRSIASRIIRERYPDITPKELTKMLNKIFPSNTSGDKELKRLKNEE